MLSPENAQYLYQELGCKLAVGMPFKDIATSDSILMRSLPPSSDVAARRALNRLIDVSMGVVVPAAVLDADPLPNAVALMSVREARSRDLPPGAIRLAIQLDGSETDEELESLPALEPIMLLNTVSPEFSNLHSSRRLFEVLKRIGSDVPVINHLRPGESVTDKNELALQMGMTLGGLMTDGLGDGVLVEPATKDFAISCVRVRASGAAYQGGGSMMTYKKSSAGTIMRVAGSATSAMRKPQSLNRVRNDEA
jgi:(E)-4-hydroxy-3-methylbut-2-enyl-diphosphate synthase